MEEYIEIKIVDRCFSGSWIRNLLINENCICCLLSYVVLVAILGMHTGFFWIKLNVWGLVRPIHPRDKNNL